MANPLYIQILKNGPFIPMVRVEESTDGDMVIPTHYAPKDPSEYTEPEKEKVFLDSGLHLILIKSLDNVMYNKIFNCDTAKQIWEKIEILCEGTKEVRDITEVEAEQKMLEEAINNAREREKRTLLHAIVVAPLIASQFGTSGPEAQGPELIPVVATREDATQAEYDYQEKRCQNLRLFLFN
ncbi:hypothetical protein AgCh_013672 [Apium graveolens]